MIWLFVALAAVGVVVVGLVAVGRVTLTLAQLPPERVFDLDEAVDYIAERLPGEVTAELSYDDVAAIVGFHLDYLEAKGVAREDTEPERGEPGSWVADESAGPVVADEDEGLAYVLGRLADAGMEIDDTHVVAVLEGEEAYLRAIGAVGGEVSGPEDPV